MRRLIGLLGLSSLWLLGCGGATDTAETASVPDAAAAGAWMASSSDGLPSVGADDVDVAGRYLAVVALCNDCHTEGWLPDGDVPEERWMTGNPVGYEGPWGVTFASNLRLRAQEWTEEQWVQTLKTRKLLRPMPWAAVNAMSEKDLTALYRYLRNLGPAGERMPAPIPPGAPREEPFTTQRVWPAGTELPWDSAL
jgi:mono/diheme cytochrome c family protein